jgi:hypothetical protein
MAYTTINKGSSYFDTSLWTGTSATQSITSLNFKPDWLWVKSRSTASNHRSQNSVTGVTKGLNPNQTVAETTLTDCVTSFNSNGFTLGADADAYVNTSSRTYVGWSWLASNTTTANTSGSISSTVSANTTSGFSIVSYTGTGANATVGHGLGVAPNMIICKSRTQAQNWAVYHSSLGNTKALFLDGTSTGTSASYWNNTSPTSTVFTVGNSGDVNYNAGTQISYCFANVKGFSKFGSYVGNSSTDGTFVYLGFKPSFVIIKNTTNANNWIMLDNKRGTYNLQSTTLYPNTNDVETSTTTNFGMDFLSNGMKMRTSGDFNTNSNNASGNTYIYMAFAENPFVSSTFIPTTAR